MDCPARSDWTTAHFKQHGSETPRLDAEILLAHARGCKRIELYTRFDEPMSEAERTTMRDLTRRRAKSEPVAYLVGHREFFSLKFRVTPDVLIPRPETETLVVELLDACKSLEAPQILDIGTGSGCIAVTVAVNNKSAQVTATDLSEAALAVARSNAEAHAVSDRIRFLQGDLFTPLDKTRHSRSSPATLPTSRSRSARCFLPTFGVTSHRARCSLVRPERRFCFASWTRHRIGWPLPASCSWSSLPSRRLPSANESKPTGSFKSSVSSKMSPACRDIALVAKRVESEFESVRQLRYNRSMSDEHHKPNGWPWAVVVLFLPLALYTGGYFLLSKTYTSSPPGRPMLRVFQSQVAYMIYRPAAWLESKTRGQPIAVGDAMPGSAGKQFRQLNQFEP